jgi:hypothetical protein
MELVIGVLVFVIMQPCCRVICTPKMLIRLEFRLESSDGSL